MHDQPQNRLASVNRLGSSETPRRIPRGWTAALISTHRPCREWLRDQRRQGADAAHDPVADLGTDRGRGWQEQIDTRTKLHDPKSFATGDLLADGETGHDAAGQDADNLTAHHRDPTVIEPDLGPLVEPARLLAVRGQELPAMIVDARHRCVEGRTIHMHVHRRQEDADLLPIAWRGARARRSDDHDPAVSWG